MQIFLVGGAVRDQLLGLPIKERDWVVVGASPEEMISKGYKPVGKDFPVFLHPETHEEYALARTERKIGKGYKGFSFHADKTVTLAEDLKRRDLTINAIAKDSQGRLIDPYHGQRDLKNKVFRHVSPAFQEDPVRILRIARFASKFVDFSLHADTLLLMQNMVNAGEVNALVAERVWQELSRALQNEQPSRFFEILAQCHALTALFPQIKNVEQSTRALCEAEKKTNHNLIRFAAFTYQLEKNDFQSLYKRYRVPKNFYELTSLVAQHHANYCHILTKSSQIITDFILSVDALRRTKRFDIFLETCQIVTNCKNNPKNTLINLCEKLKAIDTSQLQQQNLPGKTFAKALYQLRIDTISLSRKD